MSSEAAAPAAPADGSHDGSGVSADGRRRRSPVANREAAARQSKSCVRMLVDKVDAWFSQLRTHAETRMAAWEREYREEQQKEAKAEVDEPENITNATMARDAEDEGLTAVLGKDGTPQIMKETDFGDKLKHYEWHQNDTEVTVKVPVPKATKAKDVTFAITTSKLKLDIATLERRPMLDGELWAKVEADNSIWTFDDLEDDDERKDTHKVLTLLMTKLRKTQAKMHWTTVVKGEPEIDTKKFGPAIMQVSPDNPNDIASVLADINEQ